MNEQTRATASRRLPVWLVMMMLITLLPLAAYAARHVEDRALSPDPDLILYNGEITTMDEAGSEVSAVAIKDGTIVATGTDRFVRKMAGKDTERIDLRGRRVLPGLIDSHLHGLRNGYHCFEQTVRLDLVTSRDAALDLYGEKAQELDDSLWIWTVFGGWNVAQLDTPGMFSIGELDEVAPDNPVWVTATGFAGPQVNSAALAALGLAAGDEGVELDDSGDPTGQLTGSAAAAASSAISEQLSAQTIERQAECLASFIADANSLGLTAWGDPEGNQFPWVTTPTEFSKDLHGHQPVAVLHRRGELNARVAFHQMNDFGDIEGALADYRNMVGFLGDDMLRLLGPGESFCPGDECRDYEGITAFAAANRLSLQNHASAEDEIDRNLAGYEAADAVHPIDDLVWSIAHPGDGLPTDEQLARAEALNVGWHLTIGGVRNGSPGARFRTVMENSSHMCLATDAMNVAPYAPFQKIWYMVSGQTMLPGVAGVPEEQRLTREEALRHSTVECAWFLDQEDTLGSIEIGKHADLIVLSDDYFDVADDAIKDLRSVLTIVDGRVVHVDEAFEDERGKRGKSGR